MTNIRQARADCEKWYQNTRENVIKVGLEPPLSKSGETRRREVGGARNWSSGTKQIKKEIYGITGGGCVHKKQETGTSREKIAWSVACPTEIGRSMFGESKAVWGGRLAEGKETEKN